MTFLHSHFVTRQNETAEDLLHEKLSGISTLEESNDNR